MPIATFVRDYARVLEQSAARDEEVVLERRAGKPTFVLSPLRRLESDRHAVSAVAHVLRHALAEPIVNAVLSEALVAEFPWAVFLPTSERERFATELLDVLRGCAALGRFTAFDDMVSSWEASAHVWSDPALAAVLSAPIDVPQGGDVDEPSR